MYPGLLQPTPRGQSPWNSVRAGIPYELVLQIQDGLVAVSKTDQGKDLLKSLYNINGLAPATDAEYNSVRTADHRIVYDADRPADDKVRPKIVQVISL